MKYRYCTSISAIVVIVFLGIMSIISKDKENSLLEGRPLESAPIPGVVKNIFMKEEKNQNEEKINKPKENIELTSNNNDIASESGLKIYLKQILDGEYFQRWDKYLSDHIYMRETMVKLYMDMQKKINKKYLNGVFIGDEGYIFSEYNYMFDNNYINERVKYFNEFASEFDDVKFYLTYVPNKSMVDSDKFPIDGYQSPQHYYINKFLDGINEKHIKTLDLRYVFRNESNLYYKTDHHWTMNGAYLGYKNIINLINKEFKSVGKPKDIENFDIETYKGYFMGSDGRKVGYIVDELDDISIYKSKDNLNYKSYYNGEGYDLIHEYNIDSEIFNSDYEVYLGGDKSEIIIENYDNKNDLDIMVIGDSMDNPIIPLMVPHFKTIYSIDLRYHTSVNMSKMIEKTKPDIVLFIGQTSGFIDSSSEVFMFNK